MAIFKGIHASDYKQLTFPSLEHKAQRRWKNKGDAGWFYSRNYPIWAALSPTMVERAHVLNSASC